MEYIGIRPTADERVSWFDEQNGREAVVKCKNRQKIEAAKLYACT